MKMEVVAVILTCMITSGSVLIFLGRQLQVLKQISEAQKEHSLELKSVKERLIVVETKQADCDTCP